MPSGSRFADTTYGKASVVILLGIVTALIGNLIGLNLEQSLALTVFLVMIYATLLLWSQRLPFAFLGIFVLFFLGLLDTEYFVEHSHLDVIMFLIAMMTVIGYLEEDKFFEFVSNEIIRRVGISFKIVFMVLFFMSGFLAPLVDEVTAILIMSSIAFSLSDRLAIDPFPLVLSSVFAIVIGGTMTPLGNPIGVLIAFESGYTFMDFLRWSAPLSLLSLLVTYVFLSRKYKAYIKEADTKLREKILTKEGLGRIDLPRKILFKDIVILLTTLVMLALHHTLEEVMGLEKNTLLLGIPFLLAAMIQIFDPQKGFHAFQHKVEWPTLVFFLLLFSAVGALSKVGLIDLVSKTIASYAYLGIEALIVVFVVTSVPMTALMDNVVAASVLAQVVHGLEASGINPAPFWWLALICTDRAGTLTPIGSTANIIALGILEKRYKKSVSFLEWVKYGFPVAFLTISLSATLIYLQIPLMQPHP
jgi:Na+/H+ antiporter NhaD/arsenite permease-like protein